MELISETAATFHPDKDGKRWIYSRVSRFHSAMCNMLSHETFDAACIPGWINLPVAQIHEQARDALPDMKQEIAVYCWSET